MQLNISEIGKNIYVIRRLIMKKKHIFPVPGHLHRVLFQFIY